jgi:hypothetical protein
MCLLQYILEKFEFYFLFDFLINKFVLYYKIIEF